MENIEMTNTGSPIEDEAATKCTPHDSQASLKNADDTAVSPPSSSSITLTFLFVTGNRTQLVIDESLLQSSSMPVKDPQALPIISLKHYLLDHWRAAEWGAPPTLDASLRLIYLGKFLDDNLTLADYKLSATGPNVIHLSVRPESFLASQSKTLEKFRSRHATRGNTPAAGSAAQAPGSIGTAGESSRNNRTGSSCCNLM